MENTCLWSDKKRIELGLTNQNIGYNHIKQRRLIRPVNVAAGGTIGQYVPFNFCPRSAMLFVIHRGHDDFKGGQERVLYFISDIDTIRLTNDNCFFLIYMLIWIMQNKSMTLTALMN